MQLTITRIEFSEVMSYGKNVVFDIRDKVTQLIGPNGSGKSSIPLILEEGLYNKNSRGVKKADLFNWNTESKNYEIKIHFSLEDVEYIVEKKVASTTKVKLYENGKDISGHTATQTYKLIESLIKLDFNVFSKLVYQSVLSGLDFLNATDGKRKDFLISLLELEKYEEASSIVKKAHSDAKKELELIDRQIESINKWITNTKVPEVKETVQVPEYDESLEDELSDLKAKISNISFNNKIAEEQIQVQNRLDSLQEPEKVEPPIELKELEQRVRELETKKAVLESEKTKLSRVKDTCPTCGQAVDISDTKKALEKAVEEFTNISTEYDTQYESLKTLKLKDKKHKEYKNYLIKKEELESRLDSTKPTTISDCEELESKRKSLVQEITKAKNAVEEAKKYNNTVEINNAKAEQVKESLDKYTKELNEYITKLEELKELNGYLSVLVQAFSNKGLINFKIESTIKTFEELINEYLQVLSDGTFALSFEVEDTKLLLKVYSNGRQVDIKSLSSGEFNKVNTATLLSVRKLMTAISKVNINVLFLDEVISVLDSEGKNTLIEVLLQEDRLNSIAVSHGYTHPLARKVSVINEEGISRLEEYE